MKLRFRLLLLLSAAILLLMPMMFSLLFSFIIIVITAGAARTIMIKMRMCRMIVSLMTLHRATIGRAFVDGIAIVRSIHHRMLMLNDRC
jgi:hypothetical protein